MKEQWYLLALLIESEKEKGISMEHECIFCNTEKDPSQSIILENNHVMFLQLESAVEKGITLEGAGVIVPKLHRETVFDLKAEEWMSTYELLTQVKQWIDDRHQPDGYNIGWNSGEIAGQHILHAHLHILPRYKDETNAGKGIRYLFKQKDNRIDKAK